MEFLIFFLVLSLAINIFLGIYFYQTSRNIIPKYEQKLIDISQEFEKGYQRLQQADISRAFEEDDYVGDSFVRIKNIYMDLQKFLTEDNEHNVKK